MFFSTFSYLKFLLKSTNQHGVHSPFVYNFVTKGLYKKELKVTNFGNYSELKNLSKKEQKILSKIVNYFKIDSIYFDLKELSKTLDNDFNLIYFSDLKKINTFNLTKLNSNNFIIVNGIYKKKENHYNWLKIIKKQEVKVSIDLFNFGIIFFRREQAKEHFSIRV